MFGLEGGDLGRCVALEYSVYVHPQNMLERAEKGGQARDVKQGTWVGSDIEFCFRFVFVLIIN